MRFSNPKMHQIRSRSWWDGPHFPFSKNPFSRSWPFEPRTQHTRILIPGTLFACKAQLAWNCLFTPTHPRRAILTSKLGQTDLVLVWDSGFISRSTHVKLQTSMFSSYYLCHPGWHHDRHADIWPAYLNDLAGLPLIWKVTENHGINFVWESQGILLSYVYRPSCLFSLMQMKYTHSVHVITKWQWKEVGVEVDRLWVQVMTEHHCVVTLGKLLTPVCLCHQAV